MATAKKTEEAKTSPKKTPDKKPEETKPEQPDLRVQLIELLESAIASNSPENIAAGMVLAMNSPEFAKVIKAITVEEQTTEVSLDAVGVGKTIADEFKALISNADIVITSGQKTYHLGLSNMATIKIEEQDIISNPNDAVSGKFLAIDEQNVEQVRNSKPPGELPGVDGVGDFVVKYKKPLKVVGGIGATVAVFFIGRAAVRKVKAMRAETMEIPENGAGAEIYNIDGTEFSVASA